MRNYINAYFAILFILSILSTGVSASTQEITNPINIPEDSTVGKVSAFVGYGLIVFIGVFLFIMLLFYLWHFFNVPKEELVYGDMLYSSEAIEKRSAAFFKFLHSAVPENEISIFRFIDRMVHHRKNDEEIERYLVHSSIDKKDAKDFVDRYRYLRKEYTLLKLVQHLKNNNRGKEVAIGTLIRRGIPDNEAVEEVEKLWEHV